MNSKLCAIQNIFLEFYLILMPFGPEFLLSNFHKNMCWLIVFI